MLSPTLKRTVAAAMAAVFLVAMLPLAAFAAPLDPNHAALTPAAVSPMATVKKDAFEPDDTWQQAKPMPPVSNHTWHQLINGLNDADWMYFTAEETGTPFFLEVVTPAYPQSYSDDPYIIVYDEAGVATASDYVFQQGPGDARIASNDDHMGGSEDAGLVFTAPHPGKYYVRVESDDVPKFMGYPPTQLPPGQWGQYTFFGFKGIGRRIDGADRYEIARKISQFYTSQNGNMDGGVYHGPATGIVIANGLCLADAMTGGMLAAATGSPLLLTQGPNSISPAMMSEMRRLCTIAYWRSSNMVLLNTATPQGIGPLPGGPLPPNFPKLPLYVVGGTASISDSLAKWIDETPNDKGGAGDFLGDVIRIGGADRYAVASGVMDTILNMHQVNNTVKPSVATTRTAFIANGQSLADVMAAAPVANATCSELLLTRNAGLPGPTKRSLKKFAPNHIVIVGGTASVPDSVFQEASATVGGNIERVAGPDSYSTAGKLVDWEIKNGQHGVATERMIVVSGTALSDAMLVVPLAYELGNAPVLFTKPMSLSTQVKSYINTYRPLMLTSYMIGGTASISNSVKNAWNAYGHPWDVPPNQNGFD